MRIDVVTLFPEFVQQCTVFGVIGRAVERGLLEVEAWNPRDYAEGGYRRVDDSVCGGGASGDECGAGDLPESAGKAAHAGQGTATGFTAADDFAVRTLRRHRRAPAGARDRRGTV